MSFKLHFRCGNPPLCSGVLAVPSGPKSHTFTAILAVFAPSQDGVINREKVYFIYDVICLNVFLHNFMKFLR